jgi:hypothetical protein
MKQNGKTSQQSLVLLNFFCNFGVLCVDSELLKKLKSFIWGFIQILEHFRHVSLCLPP